MDIRCYFLRKFQMVRLLNSEFSVYQRIAFMPSSQPNETTESSQLTRSMLFDARMERVLNIDHNEPLTAPAKQSPNKHEQEPSGQHSERN
jgi:hypothetical protein